MTSSTTKKQVSFHPRVTCKRALHINNYSDDEVMASFYQEDDYLEMREDVRRCVQLIEQGHDHALDDINYCRTGVENRTTAKLQNRVAHRMRAVDAVLNEVDRQWNAQEEYDDEIISELYKQITASTTYQAHSAALAIQNEIHSSAKKISKASGCSRLPSPVVRRPVVRSSHSKGYFSGIQRVHSLAA